MLNFDRLHDPPSNKRSLVEMLSSHSQVEVREAADKQEVAREGARAAAWTLRQVLAVIRAAVSGGAVAGSP